MTTMTPARPLVTGGVDTHRDEHAAALDNCVAWRPARIPKRYHRAMSTQIAVRLPDELVAYVDRAVAAGRVKSRAELVSRLIARDARRQRAEEDLQRLIDAGALGDDEALAMARATSATPINE